MSKLSHTSKPEVGLRLPLLIMLFVAFLIFLLVVPSCDDGSSKANILPPDIQYMADTMFSKKRRLITKQMDTLCMQRSEALISHLVDSLVHIEEQSIKELSGHEK